MITTDPKRTPTFIDFANPDFYLTSGSRSCKPSCFSEYAPEAWSHGDVNPQINTTWLGMVGPGVTHRGVDGALWSDHTDIQPTMMAALGLRDDYQPDGRVLTELLDRPALAASARSHYSLLVRLGQAYSQIEAPVGAFGLDTLRASTRLWRVAAQVTGRTRESSAGSPASVTSATTSALRCECCYSAPSSAAGH